MPIYGNYIERFRDERDKSLKRHLFHCNQSGVVKCGANYFFNESKSK